MSSSKTVLIVDDEVDILDALGFFLRRKGIEVLTAQNGQEALLLLQQAVKIPDLILLDGNMPIMNAREFLESRKVNNIHPTIPVILLSSEVWQNNETEILVHIPKPFDLMNLLERIDSYL